MIKMVCRVLIKLVKDDKEVKTKALLNSGFEANTPDIAIPINIAKQLDLWPPREDAKPAIIETGGGETSAIYYEEVVKLYLILGDREPKVVDVNVIVNPHIREVLISDYVASQLGVILLDFKKGYWRLSDDPPNKIRSSY